MPPKTEKVTKDNLYRLQNFKLELITEAAIENGDYSVLCAEGEKCVHEQAEIQAGHVALVTRPQPFEQDKGDLPECRHLMCFNVYHCCGLLCKLRDAAGKAGFVPTSQREKYIPQIKGYEEYIKPGGEDDVKGFHAYLMDRWTATGSNAADFVPSLESQTWSKKFDKRTWSTEMDGSLTFTDVLSQGNGNR